MITFTDQTDSSTNIIHNSAAYRTKLIRDDTERIRQSNNVLRHYFTTNYTKHRDNPRTIGLPKTSAHHVCM